MSSAQESQQSQQSQGTPSQPGEQRSGEGSGSAPTRMKNLERAKAKGREDHPES